MSDLPPLGKGINQWLIDAGIVADIKAQMREMYAIAAERRRGAHREYVEDQRKLGVKITVIKD